VGRDGDGRVPYAVRPANATGAKAEGAVQPKQQFVSEPGTGEERVRHGASSEVRGENLPRGPGCNLLFLFLASRWDE